MSDNPKGEVLFSSNLTDNYFKMIRLPISNGGLISINKITKLITITVNSSDPLRIDPIYHDTNTKSSFERIIACEADDPSCDRYFYQRNVC